ncbi:MAG TPA: hypothetical protein DDX19_06145 [Rhodopirellula baltica]|nr:hypothetical protein [Rhodopirellula baltica]
MGSVVAATQDCRKALPVGAKSRNRTFAVQNGVDSQVFHRPANAGQRDVCNWRSDSECNFSTGLCLSSSR